MSKASSKVDLCDLDLIVNNIESSVWSAFKNKSIFITGGTGFIGCWLLDAFIYANSKLNLNLKLTVLSRNPDAFRAKAPHLANAEIISLLKGDVTSLSDVSGKFDMVIHAATDVVSPDNDPKTVFEDIKRGVEEALALAQRSGAKQFLLTSSGAIYGRQPPELSLIGEDFIGSPDLSNSKSAYGLGKRYSEWLVNIYREQHGLDTKIARCFAFVGPYMALDAQFAIGNFIGDCINKRDIIIGGDGTPYRSYLYAADLVVWLLTILIKGDNAPYNVGSSSALQISELAHSVRSILKAENNVVVKKEPVAGRLPERYIPSVERVATLGLKEFTSFDDSVLKTAEWNLKTREFPA